MLPIQYYIYALLAGIIPSLVWLYFWLKEDSICPEPKRIIFFTFLGGMMMVILVIPFQSLCMKYFPDYRIQILSMAFLEETFKFLAVYFFAIYGREKLNEPIDMMILMITAALGFAALENALYIFTPISNGHFMEILIGGNMRFLGATLVHVASSAAFGFMIGIVVYHAKIWKVLLGIVGLVLATALHTLFNLFIIRTTGKDAFIVFSFVWVAVVIVLMMFEEIKRIHHPTEVNI